VISYNETELLSVFGDYLSSSDVDRGLYNFKYQRPDGISIQLSFSAYEANVGLIVNLAESGAGSYLDLTDCISIRVLDENRKVVEVKSGKEVGLILRIVIALTTDSILMASYQSED
jgi:hypothetical protein